jgi:hypothetical protein
MQHEIAVHAGGQGGVQGPPTVVLASHTQLCDMLPQVLWVQRAHLAAGVVDAEAITKGV